MIGNDIIDLTLAKLESNWKRRGFLEKQFTANEQKLILTAKNSFVLVWKFWSMKEAAYKICVQQNETRFFAPKKFYCLLQSGKKGLVYFKDQIFYTSSIVNEKYIFTLASSEKETKAYSKIIKPELIDKTIKKKLEYCSAFSALEIEQKNQKMEPLRIITKICFLQDHVQFHITEIMEYFLYYNHIIFEK